MLELEDIKNISREIETKYVKMHEVNPYMRDTNKKYDIYFKHENMNEKIGVVIYEEENRIYIGTEGYFKNYEPRRDLLENQICKALEEQIREHLSYHPTFRLKMLYNQITIENEITIKNETNFIKNNTVRRAILPTFKNGMTYLHFFIFFITQQLLVEGVKYAFTSEFWALSWWYIALVIFIIGIAAYVQYRYVIKVNKKLTSIQENTINLKNYLIK